MKYLSILILLSIISINCDSTNPVDSNIYPIEKYYPLKIGNKWEYSFNTVGEIALVQKIIKNNIIHEDGSNIWGYTKAVKVTIPDPNEPIDGYITIKNDGLYFYSSDKDTMVPGTNILCKKQLLLKSPVIPGSQWETNDGALSQIINIGDYKVLNNIYSNTILVTSKINQSIDSSWYSLNIGLIKQIIYIQIEGLDTTTTKWELRNYSIL